MNKIGTDSHFSHPAKANSSLKKKELSLLWITKLTYEVRMLQSLKNELHYIHRIQIFVY